MMKSGSVIKLLRTADGMSQTALAQELCIARTYLSQVENNRVEPGMQLLRAVSEKFQVPLPLLVIDEQCAGQEIFAELRKLLSDVLSARIALRGVR